MARTRPLYGKNRSQSDGFSGFTDRIMYETEIKILEIDRALIEEKLDALGAKKIFDGEIYAVYYDNEINSIRRSKGMLRLRREGMKSMLTFKKYVEEKKAKIREESEVEVSDFDKTRSILESAGFSVWLEMKKKRTTYELNGIHFEIDKYHDEYGYIPEFLEIEGPDIGEIHKYAELLGFKEQDCRPWDALQVAEHYSNRR
ncbi:MAG: class IV adenylate cyclase [Nitrospirota bacterium]